MPASPTCHADLAPARAALSGDRLELSGSWTAHGLRLLPAPPVPLGSGPVVMDGAGIAAFDTAGAWALQRLRLAIEAAGRPVSLVALRPAWHGLLALVAAQMEQTTLEPEPPPRQRALERLGRAASGVGGQALELLHLLGESGVGFARALLAPRRIRWRALLHEIQTAGVEALPIIGLLSFLLGVVLAYQGGVQLRLYGANIYIVDLAALTLFRELGPMMTAIIVAGRTGSAYTAELGTMKATEEIDALTTIGIAPLDLLVLPKLLALAVALPLLTVFADAMGLLGAMAVAYVMLGVGFEQFLGRVPEAISLSSFLTGVGKAPVFAAIIGVVGCFQGFQVSGSAESVGRQTTVSVVQSIVLVIVVDAIFSVIFNRLGI